MRTGISDSRHDGIERLQGPAAAGRQFERGTDPARVGGQNRDRAEHRSEIET
jgi:hypothetical protein